MLREAILVTAIAAALLPPESEAARDTPTFHRDRERSGWNAHETALTPKRVAKGPFGPIWESPQLDGIDGQPPRLYASPLYVDRVRIFTDEHQGATFPVIVAASNAGFVYAISAFATRGVAAGTILWRTRLGAPCALQPAPLDGVPTGISSTPVIDLERKRIYVTHCDPEHRWQAYALDLGSGSIVAGWLVAVDTAKVRAASAFASQAIPHRGGGGIWGAGGPAVDAHGNVFVVTGTGYNGFVDRANDWTQSVLRLSQVEGVGLTLRGTYTPFNHCATATMDIDLGSGGAALLPKIASGRWLVMGGKQGNVYLLDRARLPGRLDRRPACNADASGDASLLPPEVQPQFGTRGPLNVFGPYSEQDAALDVARGRSVPATFRSASGTAYVFVTGSTRREEGSPHSVPPSLARLAVVTPPQKSAYLRIEAREMRFAFENPGSPLVTSNGPRNAVVWVLDENARRSASLAGPNAPSPVLYAFDAMTLVLLWKSEPGELFTSGKYNQPVVARGTVFVATDRIQAFGFGGRRVTRSGVASAPVPAAVGGSQDTSVARDGKTLYEQRCASCHDHAQGNIPPRDLIAKRSRQRIVDTLTHGAMRPHASGLDAEQIDAVASYLQ